MSDKKHFSRFLGAAQGRLHFAAHSHHLWPDVTLDAQQQYWLDSARLVDGKWGHMLGTVFSEAQAHAAHVLGLSDPKSVAFAPTTHELVLRILSALPHGKPLRVLTTDGEFHSFRRQSRRFEEVERMTVVRVPCEPFESFSERFLEAAGADGLDVVYVSQVFYNSGWVFDDFAKLAAAVRSEHTLILIDGYHGFMALPTDLSAVESRFFYFSGGYKYAMAGEGACFCHCPPGYAERPVNTGWFAEFGDLERKSGADVAYARDGTRMMGATLDPTGLYRFNAAMRLCREIGATPARIHAHVRELQDRFLDRLEVLGASELGTAQLIPGRDAPDRANFLTFRTDAAGDLHRRLREHDIVTDYRIDRLRFGFGLYHDGDDVDRLVDRLRKILK